MMLAAHLTAASWLDRWQPRATRLAEKLGWPQAWLHEFQAYRKEPRMTPEEFWVRYTLLRMETAPRFEAVKTEEDARRFYTECDYMLWRNLVHRRHSAWRRVLATMRGRTGDLLEVGCGIAPVSAWCAARKPQWSYFLWDLFPTPHAKYGLWRVRQRTKSGMIVWPDGDGAHVITALDVFEHLADPLATAERCVKTLTRGGYLHWNFVGNGLRNDLDLATEEQQQETVAYLEQALDLVWQQNGYRVSRKRAT